MCRNFVCSRVASLEPGADIDEMPEGSRSSWWTSPVLSTELKQFEAGEMRTCWVDGGHTWPYTYQYPNLTILSYCRPDKSNYKFKNWIILLFTLIEKLNISNIYNAVIIFHYILKKKHLNFFNGNNWLIYASIFINISSFYIYSTSVFLADNG